MKPAKYLLIIIISVVIFHSTKGQVSLEKVEIADEITMKIPEGFIPMALEEQRLKYVTARTPVAMFTNSYRSVDIGVNFSSTNWQGNDLEILKEFYRSNVYALYDSVNFHTDQIEEINGRNFIVHEFDGYMFGKSDSFKGQRTLSKYILILYTLYDERVLLFSFASNLNEKFQWQTVANEMKNSIKIKD